MRSKYLGNTNTVIPAIGAGTMGIGGYFTKDTGRDNYYIGVVRKSVDFGMNFIDTAELYGGGHSEELVGRAVARIRDKVFIATKVAPENLGYDDVIRSAEGSLRRLNTDYIDLYQIHWPNPAIPIKETLSAMEYLMEVGEILHVGVCNFSLRELDTAKKLANISGFDIVSDQVEYNLFDRSIEDDILPYCVKEKITVIAYSPLDKGDLVKYHKGLEGIARKYNKTVAQLILGWIVSHNNVIAIVKSENYTHIENNASADFDISSEDIEFINKHFKTIIYEIPTDKIIANKDGVDKYKPRIMDLAQSLLSGTSMKPVRVRHIGNGMYELVEGKARYWAHIHAKKILIKALVR